MRPLPLSWWLFASILVLLVSFSVPGWAQIPQVGPKELKVPFTVGPIKADPTRNVVYLTDATNNRLLAIDMTTGQQISAAQIDDGNTQGEIAISIDDSTLYLSESHEDEIMVFSLPGLSPLPTIPLGFAPQSIATGAGGRLFAGHGSTYGDQNYIVELNASGTILQSFGSTEGYYYVPLIRTNVAGTNLYATTTGLSGYLDLYKYDITGAQASAATGYEYDAENLIDFVPDEAYGKIYLMQGGDYGINVLLLADDDDSTLWPFTSAYGVAVGFNPQSNVVYGASGSTDIRSFNRANGAPLVDYVVANDENSVADRGLVETANGNALYVREPYFGEAAGVFSILGNIGSLPGPVTLYPTVPQTITFPSIAPISASGSAQLQATDSLGLPITYSVVSGPAYISGTTLIPTGAGTVVVAANQSGNLVDLPATQVLITVTVSLSPQSIAAFAPIPSQIYGAPAFSITPPVSSAGLPVTLSVQSGPASISGSTITILGAGVVTLAADQPGNNLFGPAQEVTTSFAVSQAGQIISAFTPIATQTYGAAPFAVVPPAASSGLPTTISVQSGPATIAYNIVSLTGVGTVVLVANQAGNANYTAAATVATSFSVNSANMSQKIAPFPAIPTKSYTSVPFSVTVPAANSGLPVSLAVSGPATIFGNQITLDGTGVVTLTASQAGNDYYGPAANVTTHFTVLKDRQTIAAFHVPTQAFGEAPFTIAPPTASSGLPVTLSVRAGPAVVSGDTVTLTGAGTVTLMASQAGNGDFNPASAVVSVFTVTKPLQTITPFNPIPPQYYGAVPFGIAYPTASSGLPVTVTVKSGPARISNGVVTLTGIGTVVLNAAQAGNVNYSAATPVTTSFTVSKAGQVIGGFQAIGTQTYKEPAFTIALPTASSHLPVTTKVLSGPATIAGGRITLTGAGTVTLIATQAGNVDYSAAAAVTTSFAVSQAGQSIAAFAPIPTKTAGAAPFVVAVPRATSLLPVTVSVLSGPATIAGTRVTLTGAGTVVLAADQGGNANYTAAPEVTTSFVVNP